MQPVWPHSRRTGDSLLTPHQGGALTAPPRSAKPPEPPQGGALSAPPRSAKPPEPPQGGALTARPRSALTAALLHGSVGQGWPKARARSSPMGSGARKQGRAV